jgi:hypothetical protein
MEAEFTGTGVEPVASEALVRHVQGGRGHPLAVPRIRRLMINTRFVRFYMPWRLREVLGTVVNVQHAGRLVRGPRPHPEPRLPCTIAPLVIRNLLVVGLRVYL